MTDRRQTAAVSAEMLAHVGEGHVAYVREMMSEEIARIYPGGPTLPPGVRLWALIGAGGQPILVADDPSVALAGAHDHDLVTVSRH